MELYEAIEKRRTIRLFKAPAGEDQLKRILLAGTKAPSGRNSQPWEFIHIVDPALVERIAQIKADITLKMAPDTEEGREAAQRNATIQKGSFMNASVVAVCHKSMGEAAAWLSIENISLAAVAEGLGSGISFFMGPEKATVAELLGLPAGVELACFVKIGAPGEDGYDRNNSPYGARRPEFSWLHKNKFGAAK